MAVCKSDDPGPKMDERSKSEFEVENEEEEEDEDEKKSTSSIEKSSKMWRSAKEVKRVRMFTAETMSDSI